MGFSVQCTVNVLNTLSSQLLYMCFAKTLSFHITCNICLDYKGIDAPLILTHIELATSSRYKRQVTGLRSQVTENSKDYTLC